MNEQIALGLTETHHFLRRIAATGDGGGVVGVGNVRPLAPVTRRPEEDSRQRGRESPPGAGKGNKAPPAPPHHIDEYA